MSWEGEVRVAGVLWTMDGGRRHVIPSKAVAVSRRGLIETCGLGWVFFGCCGSFWCAVHYLGVLFRCTCNLCSIITIIKN